MNKEPIRIGVPWDKPIVAPRNHVFDVMHVLDKDFPSENEEETLIKRVQMHFPTFQDAWFGRVVLEGSTRLHELLETIHTHRKLQFFDKREVVSRLFSRVTMNPLATYIYETGIDRNACVYPDVTTNIFVNKNMHGATVEILLGENATSLSPVEMHMIKHEDYREDQVAMILRAFHVSLHKILTKLYELANKGSSSEA